MYFGGSGCIRNNTISGNHCEGDKANKGGGIAIETTGQLVVVNNIITGNSAPLGGGISCSNSNAEITDNIISNNRAFYNQVRTEGSPPGGLGGGIYCSSSSPIIARNTIASNSVSGYYDEVTDAIPAGAGIFCTQASNPTIHQNIIAHNYFIRAQNAGGGGIFCEDPTSAPSISCCDVYGNTNANYGGTLTDQTGLNGNFSLDPIFCDASNDVYSLDLLSPCLPDNHPNGADCGRIGALGSGCGLAPPHGLAGTPIYNNNIVIALLITWDHNMEPGISRYNVYKGNGEGFTPGPSSLLASVVDTFCGDGQWRWNPDIYYKISAEDSSGHRSGYALLRTEDMTRVDESETPKSTYLSQNYPNPFNPTARIGFGLSSPGNVSLRIYDVAGRLVRELVNEKRQAGIYEEPWDGRDSGGRMTASGVYFYRLEAGSITQTRKMVLLR